MPAEGRLSIGPNGQPAEVHHHAGHWFMVDEVLCHRQLRDGTWRMRVRGALPGNPTYRGYFIMIASQIGPLGRCIISPGPSACECSPPLQQYHDPAADRGDRLGLNSPHESR